MKIYWILALFLTGAASVSVMLNHPTSLSCGCSEYVVWRKTLPIISAVAECLKEDCSVTERFKERFAVMHEKNYSLFLKSAKYNDQGKYECSCNGFHMQINLDVVVPINVTAVELGNITLPCYADTQSGVRDVTWLHNEQKALHYTANGAINPGDGYEHRVSLTENGFRDGDVSLTITGVQKRDAGIYHCFIDDENIKGYPHAYMLHVNGASSVTVMLNHPTSLPCDCSENVVWRKTLPVGASVAECLKEECFVTEGFKERFTVMHEKNYSLFLKSAKYNDQGQYECSCDGFDKQINLDVVVSINVTAVELGNVTLPCYADTQNGVEDVMWLHGEQKALHYTANGATNPGVIYEHRVSLTEDGFRDGDVSLTITGVQKRDAGLYRCFVDDENIKGYPHAYMLHVNGGDQTEDSDDEKRARFGLILSVSLTICFSLFICFLLVLLYRKKMASPSVETTDPEPVEESHEMSNLRTNDSSDHSNDETDSS